MEPPEAQTPRRRRPEQVRLPGNGRPTFEDKKNMNITTLVIYQEQCEDTPQDLFMLKITHTLYTDTHSKDVTVTHTHTHKPPTLHHYAAVNTWIIER